MMENKHKGRDIVVRKEWCSIASPELDPIEAAMLLANRVVR